MHEPSYYAVIPATVRYDKKLPQGAKLLYGEISALANKEGYCWASNQHFATLYELHKNTISDWVNKLAVQGYIKTKVHENGERQIFLCHEKVNIPRKKATKTTEETPTPHTENRETPTQKTPTPPHRKPVYNSKLNIKDNNNNSQSELEEKPNADISELIHLFSVHINPACENYYNRKVQRDASARLIKRYGMDRLKVIISKTLPALKPIAWLPNINTPLQLEEKWSALETGIAKIKSKNNNNVPVYL